MPRPTFFLRLAASLMALLASTQGFVPMSLSKSSSSSSSSSSVAASTTTRLRESSSQIDTSFMWNRGLNFGKGDFKFYRGFEEMMSVFPPEDREAFPDVFNLPKGVYEVSLTKPLGIVFEEIEIGRGLVVQELVQDGNAAKLGDTIQPGDILVGMTAIKIVGAKYERRLIPARNFDFDTMVGAVTSNDSKYGCSDVVLMLERPDQVEDPAKVANFLDFFEPPFDTPWKQAQ